MNLQGNCAECGEPLVSYAEIARHGWLTIDVGWRRPMARVHTRCRGRFEARPLEDRQKRAEAAR